MLQKKQAVREDGVEISLDPEALDLDEAGLQEKYEEQLRKRRGADDEQEDLTDMVAEHAAKQSVRTFCLFRLYDYSWN